ncbi:6146_t:CDS:2 [Cetraspora pellucida]|uniref:6146_t:CDS:1 n=1 Tax=Cetraspora pellucida TaxID=1433469 RepID=A0A9N8VWC9_9GLOM|nr:6146_t:CDS:2 [Cetraspora pellucida]
MESDSIKIIHVSTTEEKNECHKIRVEIFVKEQHCNPENELDEYDGSPSCHHFLALKSSLPIGTIRIHPYPSPVSTTGKIGRLSVLKPYRNMGVGELLLRTVESFAKSELGFKKCMLHSQIDKKEWYEKRGYTAFNEIFIEEGIEHCKMTSNS